MVAGIVLCMCPANKRQHYIVTSSLIGWVHTHKMIPVVVHSITLAPPKVAWWFDKPQFANMPPPSPFFESKQSKKIWHRHIAKTFGLLLVLDQEQIFPWFCSYWTLFYERVILVPLINFYQPTQFLSANVRGPVSFALCLKLCLCAAVTANNMNNDLSIAVRLICQHGALKNSH